jgi:predicted nucleotide-binding protein
MLTGAAIAYGLTKGGYNSAMIELEPLAMRIFRPTEEGQELLAKREALLKPRVIREFLYKYNGASLPKDLIGGNVLSEMGVPLERSTGVFEMIVQGAQSLGFIRDIKGKQYVDLQGDNASAIVNEKNGFDDTVRDNAAMSAPMAPVLVPDRAAVPAADLGAVDSRLKRVFITHGKNKGFIEPLKKLLSYGEFVAVVAAEKPTVSQPVPEKVMEDMRSCGAAIIHVEDERTFTDADGKEHKLINENVLIEIGAAMALFGRRFIIVKKEGLTLPSNLQGLYEVRYTGDGLDGNATMELLDVINDMKKRPLPS